MKAIRDEFNLLPVLWELEYFSEYLKDVEKLVDSKAKELNSRTAIMVQELEQELSPNEDFHALDLFLEEDYEKIENVFPNLLRRSLFIYVYSVLENALNNCCRLLNFQGRPLEDVKNKGRGIERARRYLEDAKVSFPTEKWEEIIYYKKLRNCIIHNQGRLKGCDHEEDVRKFALSNPHLSLMHTDDEGKDIKGMSEFVEVIFHKGFCEEVIWTISNFLEQLRTGMEYRHRNEDF
jgi:hypothetical protein